MPSRLSSLFARRPRAADGVSPGVASQAAGEDGAPPPPRQRQPVSLQRERRELARQREIEIRDIGGLALEMARRDTWKPDLLASRSWEVLGLEERIHELDALLAASEIAARGLGAQQCRCGAPVLRGAHFCSHCGRPAADTPPVLACSHCGQALPADVNFCPVCGNAVAAEEFKPDSPEPVEATMVGPSRPREGESEGP
jgi:Double zinc ribbon